MANGVPTESCNPGMALTLNDSICGLFAFSHFGGLNIGKLHITKA